MTTYPRITITGESDCYQAWIDDEWGSKRIGDLFSTYQQAQEAAEKAVEELVHERIARHFPKYEARYQAAKKAKDTLNLNDEELSQLERALLQEEERKPS